MFCNKGYNDYGKNKKVYFKFKKRIKWELKLPYLYGSLKIGKGKYAIAFRINLNDGYWGKIENMKSWEFKRNVDDCKIKISVRLFYKNYSTLTTF